MATSTIAISFRFFVFLLFFSSLTVSSLSKEVYIVYLGSQNSEEGAAALQDTAILSSVHDGSDLAAQQSVIYSYRHGFRGFSAKLSAEQAAELSKRSDVVKVFKSGIRKLHTTRTWGFLGLPQDSELGGVPHSSRHDHVILGVFDTGIWPESESFRDDGMPAVPRKWKGGCMPGENFTASMCNKKLIGAKYYLKGMQEQMGRLTPYSRGGNDVLSARDSVGHGSHTASTAAGRLVKNVNFQGLASGSARGGAPRARIAAYKVCWSPGCFDADILAAFDDAIRDGVDVLSLSLGPDAPQNDYFMDAISIGSFHAVRHGITVVGSVGNNGPVFSGATNVAPWLLTVGSSSIDRDFTSNVVLGNRLTLKGDSLSVKKMKGAAQLVNAGSVASKLFTAQQASYCLNNSLDAAKVKGKVVVCRHQVDVAESKLSKSRVVLAAGAAGMILIDELDRQMAVNFVLPATIVGNADGNTVLSYINSTRRPTAVIQPAVTVLGTKPAPEVSVFSSRGPNTVSPDILKPDIVAPGLNILAAWSPLGMGLGMEYNIVSGTSMSCPHAAGMALLLKAANPSWSPAAIKSALVTTAWTRSNENSAITALPAGKRATPFDIGGGQVRPRKAQNPGLIYDYDTNDLIRFLCSSGYDTATLQLITSDNTSSCPGAANASSDLNYPAIVISSLSESKNRTVVRTLTNVGPVPSKYRAIVKAPRGVLVSVSPSTLTFRKYGERLSYTVAFAVQKPVNDYVFGTLTWTDGRRKVRSPVAVGSAL